MRFSSIFSVVAALGAASLVSAKASATTSAAGASKTCASSHHELCCDEYVSATASLAISFSKAIGVYGKVDLSEGTYVGLECNSCSGGKCSDKDYPEHLCCESVTKLGSLVGIATKCTKH